MARPGRKLRARFPETSFYIKTLLPAIRRRKPNVWREFLRWSQLSDKLASFATEFHEDRGPIIGITNRPKINGFYSPKKNPGVIWLSVNVTRAYDSFEDGAELLLESTIMHELVHWGNYISRFGLDARKLHRKNDRGGYVKNGKQLVEVGKLFERLAYGADVNYQNMSKLHQGGCGFCESHGAD